MRDGKKEEVGEEETRKTGQAQEEDRAETAKQGDNEGAQQHTGAGDTKRE